MSMTPGPPDASTSLPAGVAEVRRTTDQGTPASLANVKRSQTTVPFVTLRTTM